VKAGLLLSGRTKLVKMFENNKLWKIDPYHPKTEYMSNNE
jgi:hypothetical protein